MRRERAAARRLLHAGAALNPILICMRSMRASFNVAAASSINASPRGYSAHSAGSKALGPRSFFDEAAAKALGPRSLERALQLLPTTTRSLSRHMARCAQGLLQI